MYYKLGQACVTNWGSFFYYKLGKTLLQTGAAITNQGNCYYKLGQNVLHTGAGITNQGNYYKLGQNNILLLQNLISKQQKFLMQDSNN